MSTRWDDRDFWPELDYSRPPAKRKADWSCIAVYSAPIICWIAAILLVLVAKGWI